MKSEYQPHAKRRGWLKNGNPAGDFNNAPRCGAKTRQKSSCLAPAMKNGRCRMHGGKSTGPKTELGLNNSRKANWKHGHYSRETCHLRKEAKGLMKEFEKLKEVIK
ncbi:hypothetical protein K1X76_10090 [bacterium]|nr:hypothetical protein [bacterium]